jgi:hypothetical protein
VCINADLSSLTIYSEYSVSLDAAKDYKKPILFYFSGFADVNSRVFEEKILTNSCVQEKINENFVFLQLYADDVNTGEMAINLQEDFMEFAMQPSWVVFDPDKGLFHVLSAEELDLWSLRLLRPVKGEDAEPKAQIEANKFLAFLDRSLSAINNGEGSVQTDDTTETNKEESCSTYESLPAIDRIIDFKFAYEKLSATKGNLVITLINPKGVKILAPEQESDMFIPMELSVDNSDSFEPEGELFYAQPKREKDQILEEVLVYFNSTEIVLKQAISIKSAGAVRISGRIIFSWMTDDAIYAPVAKSFAVTVQ